MRKILLIILTLIQLASTPLVFAVTTTINHDTQARLILDDTFKPANSPGVTFASSKDLEDKNKNSEAVFGNFILQQIAGGLITVAAPIAIIIIAIAGLLAVISHGNQGLMEKAKKTLTMAIIGLVIIIFSWVIVKSIVGQLLSTNSNQAASSTPAGSPPSSDPKAGATGEAPKKDSTTPG